MKTFNHEFSDQDGKTANSSSALLSVCNNKTNFYQNTEHGSVHQNIIHNDLLVFSLETHRNIIHHLFTL